MNLNLLNVIQFLKENYSVNLSLSYDKDKIKTRRKLQHLFSNRFKDPIDQMIYEMILSHISHAEMRCATAGQLLLSNITGNCEAVTRNIHTRDDVLMALESMGIKKILRDIMSQVLDIASASTKISLKQAVNSNFYIELILGHCFSVTPLLPISVHRQYSKIHVLCVDGYIENVSEMHHLLEIYSSNNIPLMLFARGMSEDVLNTLAVNFKRNTLNIHPFKVNFDMENANTLVDIATVCSGDVLSTTKGDLITSSLNYIAKAENISIQPNSIVLKTETVSKISEKNILEKIAYRPELESILGKRLQSLAARQISIAVPDDINYLSNTQQLDMAIRLFSSLSSGQQPQTVADEIYKSLLGLIAQTNFN